MNTIAHLDTAVLDTAAKFFRTMRKAGADFTGPMQSVAKRRNLAEYLELGCPKVNDNGAVDPIPAPHDLAHLILGDDFLTPKEVSTARGLTYANEQLEGLEASSPSIEIIAWCKDNDAMLVPTPPEALSLLDIRNLKRELFYDKEGGWYVDHPFAREDKTGAASWIALRKGIVPGSTSRKWNEQLLLLSWETRVPNAAELAWGLSTYKEVRGVYLMNGAIYARTSSVADGNRVTVGNNGLLGLDVTNQLDARCRCDFIGVSSARKS